MIYTSDFLVIGSGIAGLTFALKVADKGTVNIVTKKDRAESNTNRAQGGIATVLGKDDNFDLHVKDTLISGDGLCHEDVVEMIVSNGPKMINELIDLGVQFTQDHQQQGQLELGREGGHSRRRIVHAKDMTGRAVEQILVERASENDNITFYENHIAIDLITQYKLFRRGAVTTMSEERCWGAYILDNETNTVKTFLAKVVVLCTGGSGKVYLYTSNPDIATGDGVAAGYRAGAVVANMEFVQFHPTCLYHPHTKNFLISEAVRGEGGRLLNSRGDAFMKSYHELGDLAFRDIVARAIDSELKKSGDDCVFLDISYKDSDFVKDHFPNIYEKCLSLGIDITKEPIPVVPAAHYQCGGILTDLDARTNIKYLFALGEVAATGLHGANRLASNSLLEALVMSNRAAEACIPDLNNRQNKDWPEVPDWDPGGAEDSDEAIVVAHNWDEIRRCMWNYVGIVRSTSRLKRARRRIEMIHDEIEEYYWNYKITSDLVELRNICTVAELIIESALSRKESRGLHYTLDYLQKDDENYQRDTVFRLGKRPA